MKLLAQNLDFGNLQGFGNLGLEGKGAAAGLSTFSSMISASIGVMSIVAFIWFLYLFITGAIEIMASGADKQKLENGRNKIVHGIMGVVIVISAVFVIDIIGTIFGIPFLNLSLLFGKVIGTQ